MAVGFLGMLSIPLAVALGIIQPEGKSLFVAVLAVVFGIVALTLISLAREEHEPDRCFFEE